VDLGYGHQYLSHTPKKPQELECAKTQGITLLLGKEMYWIDSRSNKMCRFDLEELEIWHRPLKESSVTIETRFLSFIRKNMRKLPIVAVYLAF